MVPPEYEYEYNDIVFTSNIQSGIGALALAYLPIPRDRSQTNGNPALVDAQGLLRSHPLRPLDTLPKVVSLDPESRGSLVGMCSPIRQRGS